jgi:alanine dehydrogenase
MLNIGEEGGVENQIRKDHGLAQGLYLFKGVLTNKYISDSFGLPFQDLDLLLASYH